jgi:hypothetical protein
VGAGSVGRPPSTVSKLPTRHHCISDNTYCCSHTPCGVRLHDFNTVPCAIENRIFLHLCGRRPRELANHNWEAILAKMKQQHSVLDYLRQRGLYAGIDNHSKVCYRLTVVRDPRLEDSKALCYSDEDKMKDFDACVHVHSALKGFTESSRKKLNELAASSSSNDATP